MRTFLRSCLVPAVITAAFVAGVLAFAQDFTSASYKILTPDLNSGDSYGASTHYSLVGTLGAPANGIGSSNSFGIIAGLAPIPFVVTPVLSATGIQNAVNLSWTAAAGASGPVSYSFGQASASGGPYAFSSAGSALTASVGSLTAGQTYYFVVRVVDVNGLVVATSTEVSATPSGSTANTPSSGGGGGGGGGVSVVLLTKLAAITFTGRAYPLSTVTVLEDGNVVASTIADPLANFSISLTGMAAGSRTFSVYSQDAAGNRSGTFTFPVTLAGGASTDVGGIFLSPTVSVDKSDVKRGDNLIIFGQSAPRSTVTISVHSNPEFFLQTKSDAIGAYLYMLNTASLEIGSHAVKAKAALSGQISDFGRTAEFNVVQRTVQSKKTAVAPPPKVPVPSVVVPTLKIPAQIPVIPPNRSSSTPAVLPKVPAVVVAPTAPKTAVPSLQDTVHLLQNKISSKRDSLCLSGSLPRLTLPEISGSKSAGSGSIQTNGFAPLPAAGIPPSVLGGLSTKTLNLPSIFADCGDTLKR